MKITLQYFIKVSVLSLAAVFLPASLRAQVVVTSYAETGNLPANDDNYSAAASLGFALTFGGTSYTEAYVSNNGYVTFGSGSGNYTPVAFDANYSGIPIIAAFLSDVDTQNPASGLVSWGTGLVNGRAAFVAKWPGVGEFSATNYTANSFEIILVDRSDLGAGDFDVHFNYQQIAWDHGGASAGFHDANPSSPLFFEVPGSLAAGSFLDGGSNSLVVSSNAGSAGELLLQSRNGSFVVAPISVPEPSTYGLLALGGAALILLNRRRRA